MKDLNLIKRKLEEYERRIQRLKQLERELNSLNTEGLEAEANAIKSKLKNPKKVEEIERDIEALKEKIKEREEWKKTTPGLFDTAQRLANEATKLFKGKEYDKALEKYYESLRKFVDARSGAKRLKDEGLAKAIGINIYNVKKSIIACKKAIGIFLSEKARKSFDSGNYEDAISIYKSAIAKFEDAVKDAKEIGEHELVKSIEGLIKDVAENIENCYAAIDKRDVENLFKESKSLHERAAELARGGELFKARDVLRDAEEKINRAFGISMKRGFSDAISKLNFLLKTIRDEMNVIDDKIARGIETVDFSADIFKVKEEGEPEIEIPMRERKKVPAFFPAELEHFYSDIEYIGEGGFARVFKAVRIKDGKEVAVKIPISLDPETGKAFTKEIVNWSRLEHENIVELCDMNILPIPYLEMELCDKSLEEVPKPMSVEEATSIIYDVAKGLKHAHSKGIIHQDLKPSNILFKDGKAKITDWGLSKLKAGSKSSSITAFSPLYAAPEHFSKKLKKDERTDIYQLGVIFYELVTGKLPFGGEDIHEIYSSIMNEEPTLPSEINPKSKGVEHIIMKCMAKRKEERYQSVDELIEDLAVYLKEEYKKSKDFRKSAFFLYELLLQSVERGDMEAVAWATEGLLYYPKRRYSEKEVQMLKNAVRVLMDIKRNYCNESTRVRDVNRKYNELKDNLFEDFVDEIERDNDLGMVIREMNAELREDEYLDEKHVRNLEYFCVKFVKKWIERFLR